MSGIAEILLNLDMKVTGSDLRRSPVTDRLAQLGATVYEGHAASNVAGATVVSPVRGLPVQSRSCGSPGAQDPGDPESRDAG